MEDYDWEVLGNSMRVIFAKYDLDTIKNIGASTQRLDYPVFEWIIYHLISMIDPAECRRKFKHIYPTRTPADISQFLENVAQIINDLQLSPHRITSSKLRMCGGLPFRQLLSTMIKKAAEIELTRISNIDTTTIVNHNSEELLCDLDKTNEELKLTLAIFKEESCSLKLQQEKALELKNEVAENWKLLHIDLFGQSNKVELNVQDMKNIEKVSLENLEKSWAWFKEAERKIQEIPRPTPTPTPVAKKEAKRMSQYIKEMRKRLSQSPKSSSNIVQRLLHCENGLDDLISKWQTDLQAADELLLLKPDLMERFKFFEKLIPAVDIKPINLLEDPIDIDQHEIDSIVAEFG